MTCGSRAAHTAPCGAGKFAPSGAANPWTAPGYTPPADWAKIAVYNDASLVAYSGHVSNLRSWWVHRPVEANTGAQSASGDWVAVPTNLYNSGASFQTFFVPASAQNAGRGVTQAPAA